MLKSESKDNNLYYIQLFDKSIARYSILKNSERIEIDKTKLSSEIGKQCSKQLSKAYIFNFDNRFLLNALEYLIKMAILDEVSFEVGCCSHYIECSNKNQCVQKDIKTKFKCCYRHNLMNGKIFYGIDAENKIDENKVEKENKMEKYMIVDIETPFSFAVEDGISELAAIVVSGDKIIDQIHLAIIVDEAEYEEGYGGGLEPIEDNEALKSEFSNFIKKHNCPLIAHNASFEKRFLSYWGWVAPEQTFHCSLRAIKNKVPGLAHYSMSKLMTTYGFDREQKHTAIQDVLDLFQLIKIINPTNWPVVGESSSYNSEHEKQLREERKQRLELAQETPLMNLFHDKENCLHRQDEWQQNRHDGIGN